MPILAIGVIFGLSTPSAFHGVIFERSLKLLLDGPKDTKTYFMDSLPKAIRDVKGAH